MRLPLRNKLEKVAPSRTCLLLLQLLSYWNIIPCWYHNKLHHHHNMLCSRDIRHRLFGSRPQKFLILESLRVCHISHSAFQTNDYEISQILSILEIPPNSSVIRLPVDCYQDAIALYFLVLLVLLVLFLSEDCELENGTKGSSEEAKILVRIFKSFRTESKKKKAGI